MNLGLFECWASKLTTRPSGWPSNGCSCNSNYVTHPVFLFRCKGSHIELTFRLDWLKACSVIVTNTDCFSFLMILFCLYTVSALFHCILWSTSHMCYTVLDFDISRILFCMCLVVLVLSYLPGFWVQSWPLSQIIIRGSISIMTNNHLKMEVEPALVYVEYTLDSEHCPILFL